MTFKDQTSKIIFRYDSQIIYIHTPMSSILARQAELETEQRKQATMKSLMASREAQARLKQYSLEKEAELQKQEYENVTERIQKDKMRREAETLEEERKRKDHLASLQSQIQYKQQYAKDHFQDKQIEGQKLREEYDAELEKLEQLRAKEIQKLEAKGVNPKYLSEMKSLDLAKIRNC